ncbi:hypothetical protein I4U23_023493, partial [Adineta vaga]
MIPSKVTKNKTRVKSLAHSDVKKRLVNDKWRRICSIDNCQKQSQREGLCARHLTEKKNRQHATAINSDLSDENCASSNFCEGHENMHGATTPIYLNGQSTVPHVGLEQMQHIGNDTGSINGMYMTHSSITIERSAENSTDNQNNQNRIAHTGKCEYMPPSSSDYFSCRDVASYKCSHCPSSFCLPHGVQHQQQLKEEIKRLLGETEDLFKKIQAIDIISGRENCEEDLHKWQQIMRNIIDNRFNVLRMELDRKNRYIDESKVQWKYRLANRVETKVGCVLMEQSQKAEIDGIEFSRAKNEFAHIQQFFYSLENKPLISISSSNAINQVDQDTSYLSFPTIVTGNIDRITNFLMDTRVETMEYSGQQQTNLVQRNRSELTNNNPDFDVTPTTANHIKMNKTKTRKETEVMINTPEQQFSSKIINTSTTTENFHNQPMNHGNQEVYGQDFMSNSNPNGSSDNSIESRASTTGTIAAEIDFMLAEKTFLYHNEELEQRIASHKDSAVLCLSYLQLNQQDVKIIISKAIQNNTTLTTLDLSYNGIEDKGAQYLSNALQSNETLTTL